MKRLLSSNTQSIYNELKEKLDTCDDESCWLQELDDSQKKILHEKSFSPYNRMGEKSSRMVVKFRYYQSFETI